jgi:hypothetical protein
MNFLICTPFTGQTSERGIIMRYSFEFKLECVKMYECGECHSKKLRELRLKEDKEQKEKKQKKKVFCFLLQPKHSCMYRVPIPNSIKILIFQI